MKAAVGQLGSPDSLLEALPALAGDSGRRFDLVYLTAFSQIVLKARTPGPVLQELQKLLVELVGTSPAAGQETRGH